MKKLFLIILFLVGCSTKKITYKVTYNDRDYIEIKYDWRHWSCSSVMGDVYYGYYERKEVIACEIAK